MKKSLKWVSLSLVTTALLSLPLAASAQQMPDYSYVGLGGGDNGFVVNGKLVIDDNLSVRPSVATDFDFDDGEDVSYVLPITYDFNALDRSGKLYPFLGLGIGGDIGDDSTVEFALTGGGDYLISEQWAVNGAVNYLPFADGDEVGFAIGIGYVFGTL